MSRFRLCLAVGLSAAFALSLVASLRPPAPRSAASSPTIPPSLPAPRVNCVLTETTKPLLTLWGQAALPDETILHMTVKRLVERDVRGRLEAHGMPIGGDYVEVRGGAFKAEYAAPAPGIYVVDNELRDELQTRHVLAKLSPATTNPRWKFEYYRWSGNDFLSRLAEELLEVEAVLERVRLLSRKMDQETSSQAGWRRASDAFLGQAWFLCRELESARFRFLYPAVHQDLLDAACALRDAQRHFYWRSPDDGGGFGGAYNVSSKTWVFGPDERPFNFLRMEHFLDAARQVARRENALWILKDRRRDRLPEDDPNVERSLRGEVRPIALEPAPLPPQAAVSAERKKKIEEARGILQNADRLWDEVGDKQAPILYRKLLADFADVLDDLQARARVGNRARE